VRERMGLRAPSFPLSSPPSSSRVPTPSRPSCLPHWRARLTRHVRAKVSAVGRKVRDRRRRQARHDAETDAVRRQLAALSRKARRQVTRAESAKVTSLQERSRPHGEAAEEEWKGAGGFDAAAKAARILKVKERADKRLDVLLAQVNKAIQRKKWRAQEARQGKQLA
jgi:hypothetical protein